MKTRPKYRERGDQFRAPDPTEEEIEAMCLEFQATWSDEERAARKLWIPVFVHRNNKRPKTDMERPLNFRLERPVKQGLGRYEFPVVSTRYFVG